MSLLITCPQLTAEHIPLLDAAAALAWLLPWLMLCNSARANTNANTKRLIALPSNLLIPRTVSISMDLIGEFHPPSSKGNRYALTVICMHTGFVFCIPRRTKSAEDVV